jgi:hypothetical protein
MPRKFYTERDIEDLVNNGQTTLEVNEDVTLTELAYEKARRLNMTLRQANAKNPSAPERPYLSSQTGSSFSKGAAAGKPCNCQDTCQNPRPAMTGDLKERIRSAVLQRLGGRVDPATLDKIIERVLSSTGIG